MNKIISHVIEQTKWRTRQDIDTWRGAIVQAENVLYPQRIHLYTLYDEVELDGHIEGIIGQRRDGLLAEKFKVVNAAGEVVPAIQEMFNSEWFYKFLELSLESIWWGHSLIQLWDPIPGEGYGCVELVPRRHVIPETGGVSVLQGDILNTINFRQAPYIDWVVEVGGPRDHGLFKIAAPDFIIKKNAKLQWSQYTEIFGMPLRVGYTTSRQQTDMKKMADNLKNMGAAAYAVFQEGERIELLKNENKGGPEVYEELIQRCNLELSKLIIRQTMTIEDGSSLSQSEVHERVMDAVKEADKRLIRFTIKKLLKRMVKHGLIPEGTRFEWEVSIDLEALWTKVAAAMLAGYQPDLEWVEETFGIPLTKLAPAPEPEPEPEDPKEKDEDPEPEPEPEPKPKKKSLAVRRSELALACMDTLQHSYSCSCPKCGSLATIKLSADNKKRKPVEFDSLMDWVFDNPNTSKLHQPTADSIFNDLQKGFKSVLKGELPDDFSLNLQRFAAAKTFTMQDALKDEVHDEDGNKQSYDDYKSTAQTVADRFSSYQDTEYDTTATRAQAVKAWDGFQENQNEYPNLTWRTVGDARVRESHVRLNGLTRPANDPIWQKYFIGMDYNCRCDIEQSDNVPVTQKAKAQQLFEDAAPPPELVGNPGITREIFGEQHPYFKGTLKRVDKLDIAA